MEFEKKVVLGEREFVVKAKSIRKGQAWREKFKGQAELITSVISNVTGVRFDSPQDLARLIVPLKDLLIAAPDIICAMVFEYATELEPDREWILDNARDDEMMLAFAAVLTLVFPFERLALALPKAMTKPTAPVNGTSKATEPA
jgi:hypothetical protein